MKYKVYFEQVNQTKYEISAKTPEKALEKARKEWRCENSHPLATIEDEEGNRCW